MSIGNMITQDRLNKIKLAYTTRRVPLNAIQSYELEGWSPEPGDLMLARIKMLGQHKKLQLRNGRKADLFLEDEIVISCGNRYATDQFEAIIDPLKLPKDMVAGGGVASNMICAHNTMATPTQLEPLGVLIDERGHKLNLKHFKISKPQTKKPITTIVVAGTSMNSGKTTTAASVVHGLSKSGYKVGYAKLTGTGAGGDPWLMKDCGARSVLDFTDAGYASTYMVPKHELECLTHDLIDKLAENGCEIAVVEIADGVQHFETSELLLFSSLRLRTHGVFFAAYDSMGAIQGINWLKNAGYNVLALSGVITSSALARREAGNCLNIPIVTPFELQKNKTAEDIALGSLKLACAV